VGYVRVDSPGPCGGDGADAAAVTCGDEEWNEEAVTTPQHRINKPKRSRKDNVNFKQLRIGSPQLVDF
jgi:hypothetical protein